jgi:cold-inducible RNA-binding protein
MNSSKLYVGNLAYSVRDEDLQQQFGAHGNVVSAKVMMDRETGRSKGFGFVEMGSPAEAQAAIQALNGQSMGGRALTVNEARPKEDRPAEAVATAAVATATEQVGRRTGMMQNHESRHRLLPGGRAASR